MSHASVIVALSPADIEESGGDVEAAVAHQMQPFDESGGWFADGSRWDWWTIGGRYFGKFKPDYDVRDDERNYKQCWLCKGSGIRDDEIGKQSREVDPTYKCNGCNGTGKQLVFSSDFAEVEGANVCKRSDLDEEKLRAERRSSAEKLWAKFEADPRKDEPHIRDWSYGFSEDETLETLTKRFEESYITAYAFLRDRRWHEQARMGWFGMSVKTECVIKAEERGEEYRGRCLHKDEETGAEIVSFEEDGEQDDGKWNRLYWPRFIRHLPPDTTLVCVDYHV